MGGREDDKFVTEVELPVREVDVREFLVAVTPVTERVWGGVMGGCSGGDLPKVGVEFWGVREFCEVVGEGCRLMSEAEWEYVCRGGAEDVGVRSIGEGNYLYDERGNVVGRGGRSSVGEYAANGFGVYDMLGNVCEWVEDVWHGSYEGAPVDGGAWVEGGMEGFRVMRGGGWDHLPRMLRASWRDKAGEGARWDNLGFRVAFDVEEGQ